MNDIIKLTSGKEVYANCLILGIGPDMAITQGYDGSITYMSGAMRSKPDWDDLSLADVVELAGIAIDRWNLLKSMVERMQRDGMKETY